MALTGKITSARGELGLWGDFKVHYEIEGMESLEGNVSFTDVELWREDFSEQIACRRQGDWTGSLEPYSAYSDFATEKFALRVVYTIDYMRHYERIQTDVSATLTLNENAVETKIEFDRLEIRENDNPELCNIELQHYGAPGYRTANISDSKTTIRYTLDDKDETELTFQSDKGVAFNRIIMKDINRKDVAGKRIKITYLKVENEVFPEFSASIVPESYELPAYTTLNTIIRSFDTVDSIIMPMMDIKYLNAYDSRNSEHYVDDVYSMYYAEVNPPRKPGETFNLDNVTIYLRMFKAGETPTDRNDIDDLGRSRYSGDRYLVDPEAVVFKFDASPGSMFRNIEDYGDRVDLYWCVQERDKDDILIPYKKNIELVKSELVVFDKPIYELQQIEAFEYHDGPAHFKIKLDSDIPEEADFFITREAMYGATPCVVYAKEGRIWEARGLSREVDGDLNLEYSSLQSWTKGKIYIQSEDVEPNYVYGSMPYYEEPFNLKMDVHGEIKTGSNIEFDIMDPLQDRDMGNYNGMEGEPGPVVKLMKDGVTIFEVNKNWDEHNYFEIKDLTIANNGTYHSEVEYYMESEGFTQGPVKVVKSDPVVIDVKPLVDIEAVLSQSGDFVVGQPVTLSAKITSNPNTIKAVDWYKNGALLKHEGTKLNTELVIEEATKEDIGIYVVTVTYLESQDEVQLDSNAIILAETGGPTLDVNVSITGPATVNEGETITLKAEVRVTDQPEGTNIVYRWHFGTDGGLPVQGASSDKLVITKADYSKNSGKYWCGVSVIAPDFPPVIKRSNELTVQVLRDPRLSLKASVNKFEVEAGKPVELSFKHSATEGLQFEFDWYANNVKIEGSHGQNPYTHNVTEDTAFYVKATPTGVTKVITDPVKSNVVIVRAVTEGMKPDVSITGPAEVKEDDNVELIAIIEPQEVADQYRFEWTFKGKKVGIEKLYDFRASDDTVGEYQVKAINKSNPDIVITTSHVIALVDVPDITPVIKIDMPKQANYEVGDTIALVSFVTVTPDVGTKSYSWTKDGQPILSDAADMQIFRKENAQEVDAGKYELTVTVSGKGVITTSAKAVVLVGVGTNIPQPPSSNGVRYIHDLNPGRDRGYIWLGWWVHDEINDALIEGFDWRADPENERFKYKEDLKTLAYGLEKWPDLEMQESRHGYILTKRDVTE